MNRHRFKTIFPFKLVQNIQRFAIIFPSYLIVAPAQRFAGYVVVGVHVRVVVVGFLFCYDVVEFMQVVLLLTVVSEICVVFAYFLDYGG